MIWRKLGLVFKPPGPWHWHASHGSLPTTLMVSESRCRIYFAARDGLSRSHVVFVEIDPADPTTVLETSDDAVLAPGPLGCFDDHGVFPGTVLRDGDRVLLYYIGWNPGARPPLFYASIGLAVSTDGGKTFTRQSPAPILSRSRHDPCLVTSPCVLHEQDGWRMWYVSGLRWEEHGETLRSWYHVKSAKSWDGACWERRGNVCIDLAGEERNIARPCVRREADGYRMWYSYDAGDGYRIGTAESSDGEDWVRRDSEAGIQPSVSGWDSETLAYPWVFEHRGARYLLYNGRGYGREGFGIAVAEEA